MEARRLGPGDEDQLREVRLAALASDPDVFGSTLAREQDLGVEAWTARLSPPSVTLVVGEPPVAMAWGVPEPDDPGVVHVFGMWVAPTHRGTGVADALLAALVDWAVAGGTERIELTVLDGNDRAEAVYLRHGFRRTGAVETRPRDGRVEACMVRTLPAV